MRTDEIREHLTDKLLPFWAAMRDDRRGGYIGLMDYGLNADESADKGCIYHSRILWTFSTAALTLNDARWRAEADHAYAFLKRFFDQEHGGVYWSVTADGQPQDTTKHTYCQAFAIYGLSAYYRLTGLSEARERAMALFQLIETRMRDADGYGEAYLRDLTPRSNEKLSENGVMASRTMNTLLHVVEAYAELQRACPDEAVLTAGQKILAIFMNYVYNRQKRRLEVFFDQSYRSLIDMQSYGHDIEASWLLWDAAKTLLPAGALGPYRDMCLDLARSTTERALTDNGLLSECVRGVDDTVRVWWVQAETLLGLENAYELTGESVWLTRMAEQWDTIKRLFIDERPGGEWHWSVYEDGTPTGKPVAEPWKGPYHNGRMCLRMIDAGLTF